MSDNENPQFNEIKELMEEKEKLVQEGKYLEAEEIKQKINAYIIIYVSESSFSSFES